MKRLENVDALRFIAVTAVIAIHTTSLCIRNCHGAEVYSVDTIVDQVSRFAVPFFFALSGYFWGTKINRGADVKDMSASMAKRIGIVFLAWSSLYLLPYNLGAISKFGVLGPIKVAYSRLQSLAERPLAIVLFQGTSEHLWFLVSLLTCLGISAYFVRLGKHRALFVIALVLYMIGVLAKAYVDTPVGIDLTFTFDTRNGPFFGLLLFSSGYLLSRTKPDSTWRWKGLALIILGYVCHFSEIYFLQSHYGTSPRQDYVFGTYFLGLGFTAMALASRTPVKIPALSSGGRYALGIYAIHPMFLDNLKLLIANTSPIGDVISVLGVLMMSMLAVTVMSKSETLKRLVT